MRNRICKGITLAVLGSMLLTGCNKVPDESMTETTVPLQGEGYYQYLGNIDYSASSAALVWEHVEGEDPGIYGIQYRSITDFNGLTSQTDIPVCIYFYSSAAAGSQSLTAGVEDLAQTLVGKVLFIAVDGVEADGISTAYHVSGYPEFILIKDDVRVSTFSGFDYESWSIDDVSIWMTENGFTPDLTMLEE